MSQRSRRAVSALVVGAIAALLATVLLAGELAAQRPDCCVGRNPVASIYAKEPNRVERLLLTGDGQVFAALAQDPSLSRPAVLGSPAEFSYRAQRPALGYATWLASLGNADAVGAALLVLAVLGCAAAAGVGALLLQDRNASPYWALGIVVAGLESLHELTPELAAFALFGGGLLLWTRDRRAAGVLLFVLAVATRETMLVGVLGVAAWELVERRGSPGRLSRVAPLAWPFAFYAGWALLLRLRAGAWPTAAAGHRTGLPGTGLVTALRTSPEVGIIVVGASLAVVLCVAAWALARHDPLTWIATAFLVFGPTMAPVVWGTHAGFTRVLLPLYGFGLIAVASGLTARRSSTAHALRMGSPTPTLVP